MLVIELWFANDIYQWHCWHQNTFPCLEWQTTYWDIGGLNHWIMSMCVCFLRALWVMALLNTVNTICPPPPSLKPWTPGVLTRSRCWCNKKKIHYLAQTHNPSIRSGCLWRVNWQKSIRTESGILLEIMPSITAVLRSPFIDPAINVNTAWTVRTLCSTLMQITM